MDRTVVVAMAFILSALPMALSQESKDLEFEGDFIEVDPKTNKSPGVDALGLQAATAEARIDGYLNESRFKVRSGLEQAFKDFRVIVREYEKDDDPPVVNMIKRAIGAVFDMMMIVVPVDGVWQKLFKAEIVVPAMEQIRKEGGESTGDVNQFLDLLEKNYGVHVLDQGMQIYDKFKASPDYAAATDIFMENYAENALNSQAGLPADVAAVLNAAGVPAPTVETQEKTRDCALVALLGELYRYWRVRGGFLIWRYEPFGPEPGNMYDTPFDMARDVVAFRFSRETKTVRLPWNICPDLDIEYRLHGHPGAFGTYRPKTR